MRSMLSASWPSSSRNEELTGRSKSPASMAAAPAAMRRRRAAMKAATSRPMAALMPTAKIAASIRLLRTMEVSERISERGA